MPYLVRVSANSVIRDLSLSNKYKEEISNPGETWKDVIPYLAGFWGLKSIATTYVIARYCVMESDGHEWRIVVSPLEGRRSPGKCEARSFPQGINGR
jgi:hypothetical protein